MKEIEVKAKLKDKEKVLEKLKSMGCILSLPIKQIDTVYTKIIGNIDEYMKNDHFLRIREKSDGTFIFTVKKPTSWNVLTKSEHETEIKNKNELEQAIFLMGYKIANKVIKNRITTHFNEFEICIDEVEKMGTFIEVEKISGDDINKIRKEVNDFLILLNVSLDDEVKKGYDVIAVENNL